ncbi:MAG: peptidase and in kexin sedolisin [Thermoleophilia bacterium]|nr:peptidase and in kexin sedolisin [Thermoleophilia bacterium]
MGMVTSVKSKRPAIRRALSAAAVVAIATSTAVATATDLPPSTPDVYRASSGSGNLASMGYLGQNTTVVVIDTGVADVPALEGKLLTQVNLSAGSDTGDEYGHGTFVAGIVHEIAPEARIISLKLSGADGSVDVTQVLAALQWVAINRDRYSIDVVNLSFGNDSRQSANTSLLNFGVQQLWDRGIVVVASAGNAGDQPGTVTKPGDDPVIISVGSSDEQGTGDRGDDFVPGFVSRGPTQDGFAKPDLVAPGARLVSLRAPGSTVDQLHPEARVGADRFRGSGTSFSAPLVAGVVAQMLSAEPRLTPDQVKYGVLKGATWINGDAAALGAGTIRGSRALQFASSGRANVGVGRGNGSGSVDGARGSTTVDVETRLEQLDGTVVRTKVRLRGNHTAETVPISAEPPAVAEGETAIDGLDGFDPVAYRDPAGWEASSWGASSWGASQWGASQWGASSWGASSWGASSWGSSQWWASSWG